MNTRYYIDGCNLLHQWQGPGTDFLASCRALVDLLIDPFPQLADELVLVFDGQADPAALGRLPQGFRAVFCGARSSADLWIENALHREPNPTAVTVVSDDNALRESARTHGCRVEDCAAFIATCGSIGQRLQRPGHHRKPGGLKPRGTRLGRLGDVFPDL